MRALQRLSIWDSVACASCTKAIPFLAVLSRNGVVMGAGRKTHYCGFRPVAVATCLLGAHGCTRQS